MLQRIRERLSPTDIVMWSIGAVLLIMIIWGSVATLVKGVYSAHHWIDFIIFGLAQGSIYALIAMGTPWSTGAAHDQLRHSEVFMSGPYTAYYFAAYFYRSGLLESIR